MEDVGQIILIVIALVGAIAQQAAKAKKAKDKRQSSAPSHSAGMGDRIELEEDPFSWLMRAGTPKPAANEVHGYGSGEAGEDERRRVLAGEILHRDFAGGLAATPHTGKYFSYDNAYSESIYAPVEDTVSTEAHFSGVEGQRSTQDLSDHTIDRPAGAIRSSDENRTDFDLHKAVIYSEILKAKYQDY